MTGLRGQTGDSVGVMSVAAPAFPSFFPSGAVEGAVNRAGRVFRARHGSTCQPMVARQGSHDITDCATATFQQHTPDRTTLTIFALFRCSESVSYVPCKVLQFPVLFVRAYATTLSRSFDPRTLNLGIRNR